MTPKTYDKLVRDKIPEIIEARGAKASVVELNSSEFAYKLKEKLQEECKEFLLADAQSQLEELADIQEVVLAIAETLGYSSQDLEDARIKKRQARGAFAKKLLLVSAEEEQGNLQR